MPLPTNIRNIPQIGNVTGNNINLGVSNIGNSAWSFLPVNSGVQDNTNPAFIRSMVLTGQGVLVTRAGNSVGIQLETIFEMCAKINPAVTWIPIITAQPSGANVTHPAAASFNTNATDELMNDMAYQWQNAANSNAAFANMSNGGVYSNVAGTVAGNIAFMNISNSTGLNGTLYRCLVTNPSGTNTTNSATLIVA